MATLNRNIKVVTIYGYNINDFSWLKISNNKIVHTCGFVMVYENKKYVITTRSRLSSCKNIIMYYTSLDDRNIFKNELHILFQSIEFNIIILGSINRDCLDLMTSEIIFGKNNKNDINAFIFENNFNDFTYFKPDRITYHINITNLKIKNSKYSYHNNIYKVTYIESIIYDDTYLPPNYFYKFKINLKKNITGICGTIIINEMKEMIGMSSIYKNRELFVLPIKSLYKILSDFVHHRNNPKEYYGLLTLPLNLKSNKDHDNFIAINCSDIELKTINGIKKIKKDDEIIKIDNKELLVDSMNIMILDKEYNINLLFDIYLRLNLKNNIPMDITIMRKNKIINYKIFGEYLNNYIFPITNQPYFNPHDIIPYIKLKNLIIVELTHELLDICFLYMKEIKNDHINSFIGDNDNGFQQHLLIIDCLDKKYVKEFNLPSLDFNRSHNNILSLFSINNKNVTTLNDIINYSDKDNIILHVGYTKNNIFPLIL